MQAIAASVEGRILDGADGIYLEGARVEIAGTETRTFSERGGYFRIGNLDPGSYTLRVTFAGLPTITESIEITDNRQRLTVNPVFQAVDETVFELDAIEVQGSLLGSAKAISQVRAADNLLNIVASDAFGQFTDRNPAEALQRLPGISVQESQGEGKFIIIRGADPRLNSVSIDNVTAATPEEDGRRTGLNIISIDQLESIEVSKTWMPDQWANFIGGSVNLVTRSALNRNQRFTSLEAAYGQYEIAEESSYRLNGVYGDVWRLGERHLFGFQISLETSENNRGSETIDIDRYSTDVPWEIRNMPNGLNFAGYTLEDYEISRQRTGISTKLEYWLNDRHEWSLSFSRNEFDDDEARQETSLSIEFNNYGGDRFLTEAIALELGYDLADPEVQRRINIVGTSNEKRLRSEEVFQLGDVVFDADSGLYTFQKFGARSSKSWESRLTKDEITTWQLTGRHLAGQAFELDYSFYLSEAQQDRQILGLSLLAPRRNSESGLVGKIPFISVTDDAFSDPAIYVTENQNPRLRDNFTVSDDEREGFQVNLSSSYELRTLPMETKIGAAGDYRDKSFLREFESFSEIADESVKQELSMAESVFLGSPEPDYLEDFGDFDFGPRFATESTRAFLRDPTALIIPEQNDSDKTSSIVNDIVQNYNATEDIEAAYIMQSMEFGRWKVIAGLRHERTENTFRNFNLVTRPEEPIGALTFIQPVHWRLVEERLGREAILTEELFARDYDHNLPALHVIRRIGETMVLRLAYTETIKRPTFTDLIPREIPGVSGSSFSSSVRLPNFELRALESRNYDLSLDYYFEGIGAMGVSLFYKDLDGPIYQELRIIEPGQDGWEELSEKFDSAFRRNPETGAVQGSSNISWSTTKMVNAGKGHLQGIEIYFKRELDFLPDPLNGFGIDLNISFIDSEIELLRPERNEITTSSGEVIILDPSVPLFQQPDMLANASLSYQRGGFLARLSYNYRGESLQGVLVSESTLEDLVDDIGLGPDALDEYQAERGRLDLFVQYTWRNSVSLFFEATNLTNEPDERFYGDPSRLARVQYTEPVYFIGMQWKL